MYGIIKLTRVEDMNNFKFIRYDKSILNEYSGHI